MSRGKAFATGMLAGALAGIAMTFAMLLMACFRVATPLSIIGDRLTVFIKPDPFLALMGRVGGYTHLKELGVGSTMAGQIVVGIFAGGIFGMAMRKTTERRSLRTLVIFVTLPLLLFALLLWPVLGTSYRGLPIKPATVVTLLGLAISFLVFERVLVRTFLFLADKKSAPNELEFSPHVGRRALLLGGLGIVIAGGAAGILRKLFQAASFSYDGTQYRGAEVQAITPNERFYCVTKNIIDPRVELSRWRLDVTGLVATRQTYNWQRFQAQPNVTQETTLMCISNGLDAGLMSNAVWRGVPMHVFLAAARPLPTAARVRLHGVDNYTDTLPLEKAMSSSTIVAFQMNGVPLPNHHGFPARVISPGYFGEKHVKWLTRIELVPADAKGFYEAQGWGPDFIVPTRSRIDVPDSDAWIKMAEAAKGIPVRGVAFGGDRGISKVEVSFDDGKNWSEARIDYPGTKLTWALWNSDWKPENTGDYSIVVRATDGTGVLQFYDAKRPFTSGATGFHKITAHIVA